MAGHRKNESKAAVLVEIRARPGTELFEGVTDRRERLSVMRGFYEARKLALVERLASVSGVEIEDLDSGAGLIIRGAPELLAALAREDGPLADEELSIAPVVRFDELEAGEG